MYSISIQVGKGHLSFVKNQQIFCAFVNLTKSDTPERNVKGLDVLTLRLYLCFRPVSFCFKITLGFGLKYCLSKDLVSPSAAKIENACLSVMHYCY